MKPSYDPIYPKLKAIGAEIRRMAYGSKDINVRVNSDAIRTLLDNYRPIGMTYYGHGNERWAYIPLAYLPEMDKT